jgi:nucleotide-binding universal stress UspA family protein
MADDRPVLLCTDGSEMAQAAIVRACEFLAPGPAPALSIWMPARPSCTRTPSVHGDTGVRPARTRRERRRHQRAHAQEAAEAATAAARAAGFDCAARCERRDGPAWNAILACADEIDASAIVVGSHGRSALTERVLGGVAHRVVSHADRPIVLLPAPGRAS